MSVLKSITPKKILHWMHWLCMGSMLLMSGGMALAALGANTTFGSIAATFSQHILMGFQSIGQGIGGLIAAGGNALGAVGATSVSQSLVTAAQSLAPAATMAADPALHIGHAMIGHGAHHAAAPVIGGGLGMAPAATDGFNAAATTVMPKAATGWEWFQTLPPGDQDLMRDGAERFGMTLEQYAREMCGGLENKPWGGPAP